VTLDDIKARCVLQDGCWLWRGALSDGWPRIFAPDYTKKGGAKTSQPGKRAVWHVKTGKPIPSGWRVFGTCQAKTCCNPAHIQCQPVAEWGKRVAESGRLQGVMRRIVANRATGRARAKLTGQDVEEIMASEETGLVLASRYGVAPQTISKARHGKARAHQPVGGLFSGLLAANDSKRKAA